MRPEMKYLNKLGHCAAASALPNFEKQNLFRYMPLCVCVSKCARHVSYSASTHAWQILEVLDDNRNRDV